MKIEIECREGGEKHAAAVSVATWRIERHECAPGVECPASWRRLDPITRAALAAVMVSATGEAA